MFMTRHPKFQTGLTQGFISGGDIFYFLSLLALFPLWGFHWTSSFLRLLFAAFLSNSSLSINVTFSFPYFCGCCCCAGYRRRQPLYPRSLPLCLCGCCLIRNKRGNKRGLWRSTPPPSSRFFVPIQPPPLIILAPHPPPSRHWENVESAPAQKKNKKQNVPSFRHTSFPSSWMRQWESWISLITDTGFFVSLRCPKTCAVKIHQCTAGIINGIKSPFSKGLHGCLSPACCSKRLFALPCTKQERF